MVIDIPTTISKTISLSVSDASFRSVLFPELVASNILAVKCNSFKVWGPVDPATRYNITLSVTNSQVGTYFVRRDSPGRNTRPKVGVKIPACYAMFDHTLDVTLEAIANTDTGSVGNLQFTCELEANMAVYVASAAPVPVYLERSAIAQAWQNTDVSTSRLAALQVAGGMSGAQQPVCEAPSPGEAGELSSDTVSIDEV